MRCDETHRAMSLLCFGDCMIIKVKTYKPQKKRLDIFSSYRGGTYTDCRYKDVRALRIQSVRDRDNLPHKYFIAGCINNTWCSLKSHIEKGRLPHSTVAEELYDSYREAEEAIRLLSKRYGAKIDPASHEVLANIKKPSDGQQTVVKAKSDVKKNNLDDLVIFNGANGGDFTGTEPFYCDLCGKDFAQESWVKTFTSIVEHEIKQGNPTLEKLKCKSLYGDITKPFFLQHKMDNCRCALLSNKYWININYSADLLVRYIERFWLLCGYKQKDIAISGVLKEIGLRKEEKENSATKRRAASQKERNQVPYKPVEQKPHLSSLQKSAPIGAVTPRKSIDDILKGAKSSFLDKNTTDVTTSNSNLKSGYKIGPHATRAYVKMFSVWEAKYEEKVVIPGFFRIAACIGNNWKPLSYHVKTGVFPEHKFADKLYSSYNAAVADAMELASRYRARFYDATRRLQTAKVALKPSLWSEPEKSVTISNPPTDGIQTLDWNGKFNLSYTAPQVFIYRGKSYPYPKSWQDVYFKFLSLIIHEHPNRFDDGMSFLKNGKCVDLSNEKYKDNLRCPKHIDGTDYWAESNLSSSGMVLRMKLLIDLCCIHYSNVVIQYGQKREKVSSEPPPMSNEERQAFLIEQEASVKGFVADIAVNFQNGFDFSEGAKRLLESRCGVLSSVLSILKSRLFKRRDKVWFADENVMTKEAQSELLKKVNLMLNEWHCVSVGVLVDEVKNNSLHLRDDKDVVDWLEYLFKDNGAIVDGRGKDALVIENKDSQRDEVLKNIIASICDVLKENGDLVSVDDLQQQFPCLTAYQILSIVPSYDPQVIVHKNEDGTWSLKMMEYYYLPEDIGMAVYELIANAEESGLALTGHYFVSKLSERYDCDFLADFALDETTSLQGIIRAAYLQNESAPHREWKDAGASAKFVKNDENVVSQDSLKDRLVSHFVDVFTEAEFMDYITNVCGLVITNPGKLRQIGVLTRNFIKLDSTNKWISVQQFIARSNWSEFIKDEIEGLIRNKLGTHPFLSLGNISGVFLESLPLIRINESELYWTSDLLASVCKFLIPTLNVVNHGIAPHVITSLIVQEAIEEDDVLSYMVGIYRKRNPYNYTVEGAFEYL